MVCPTCPTLTGVAQRTHDELYRCEECYSSPAVCASCIAANHVHMPFHRIVRWSVQAPYWTAASLYDLKVRVCLGHGGGLCPTITRPARKMTIGVESGFQDATVVFCECVDAHGKRLIPEPIQLIHYGLFPASWEQPKSAFSIRLLRAFHLLALQSQTTARDFAIYLKRLTDNIVPSEAPDRYRELSTANREFVFLRAVRRAGLEPKRGLPAGSLAVLCPACPQIGINMAPDWRDRPAHLHFLDALFYGIDGNFHQNQKVKPLDPNDFALTLGAAYFANAEDFTEYQKTLGPLEPEPTTCHKFAAMGLGGYWNNISGTLGVSCRHLVVLPGGGVDLQKGERFVNVDFAVVSGLQRWMDLPLHISGYDINCQYRINFEKRLAVLEETTKGMASIANKKFPPTIACVGKFHLPAHKPPCQYKFSYAYTPGVGRTDGEGPERIWAILNPLGSSTREMTSGHRHDRINDHHSDMNVRRVHNLADELVKKYHAAKSGFGRASDEVKRTESQVKPEEIAAWKVEEEDWLAKVVDIKNHKDLHNPYEVPEKKALTQQEVISMLRTGEMIAGTGPVEAGVLGTIGEGIELQHAQFLLLKLLEDDFEGEKRRTEEAREAFLRRVDAWQEMYRLNLAPLINVAAMEAGDTDKPVTFEDTAEVEGADDDEPGKVADKTPVVAGVKRPASRPLVPKPNTNATRGPAWHEIDEIVIDLPTSRGPKTRAHAILKEAIQIELELRKGEANDALDDVRTQIITNYGWKRQKKTTVKGVARGTKANRAIRLKQQAIDRAAHRYRRARHCLIQLGIEKKDLEAYRTLARKDLVAFNVFQSSDQLGDSKKEASWIWGSYRFVDKMTEGPAQAFCVAASKVRWFREHASMRRWHEELLLLAEEMARLVRYFKHYRATWEKKAGTHDGRGERGMAAYARRCVREISFDLPAGLTADIRQAHCCDRLYERSFALFRPVLPNLQA
ncbi:hypothetical protein BV25DRAFT_1816572 [Artomyces pyxidatus]|uniref:Uncharacterized protein n=1 Tax=Artomyces pyxidatus TaxID=48021 RepID=A0ACB8SE62_9AGAM|nr:hypothetical protein BV25DRAFT_1816572 [Artomyces pyxidatus]